jgi:hypothetical protein
MYKRKREGKRERVHGGKRELDIKRAPKVIANSSNNGNINSLSFSSLLYVSVCVCV